MKRRSRIVVLVTLILCAFSLLLMVSPGVTHPKSMGQLLARFAQEPTPQNKMAIEQAQRKARRNQAVLGITGVWILIFVILCGWHQKRAS